MDKRFWVYMLASKHYGTLYIGMTSDLVKRISEHRENLRDGFTKEYNVHRLVWFEEHGTAESAIKRERNMKEWKRDWKINLIERNNPHWEDLFDAISK